jgi:hypothetical protein
MKYKNKKVMFDGIEFDSILERDMFIVIKGNKDVERFFIKPRIVLQPAFVYNGKHNREISIWPDYIVIYKDENLIYNKYKYEILDAKGKDKRTGKYITLTQNFKNKWKILKYRIKEQFLHYDLIKDNKIRNVMMRMTEQNTKFTLYPEQRR